MSISETETEEVVIDFPGITRLDLDPERVLSKAKGKLEGLVILGYTHEGNEYFSSSFAAGPEVLWLLERCKKRLLEIADELAR